MPRSGSRRPPTSLRSPPAGADLRIPGVGPFITPNDVFYRVDTSLLVPSVTAEGWSLRIHGMVRDELSPDYARSCWRDP